MNLVRWNEKSEHFYGKIIKEDVLLYKDIYIHWFKNTIFPWVSGCTIGSLLGFIFNVILDKGQYIKSNLINWVICYLIMLGISFFYTKYTNFKDAEKSDREMVYRKYPKMKVNGIDLCHILWMYMDEDEESIDFYEYSMDITSAEGDKYCCYFDKSAIFLYRDIYKDIYKGWVDEIKSSGIKDEQKIQDIIYGINNHSDINNEKKEGNEDGKNA